MVSISPVHSDDEGANGAAQSSKKDAKSKEDVEAVDPSEEVEASESEFEIEEILDAKRGAFPGGRMGYFVKWKGYGPADNSWVDEQDAGNAIDLIDEFWRKNPKKGRKSDVKAGPNKARRMSKGAAETQTKKRGRKSQVPDSEVGDSGDAGEPRTTKKQRKTTAPTHESSPVPPSEGEIVFEDLDKYKDVEDWEPLVSVVDTIERQEDGSLIVYFSMSSGERARELSSVCRERFPQKLISFYESNLRWKTSAEYAAES